MKTTTAFSTLMSVVLIAQVASAPVPLPAKSGLATVAAGALGALSLGGTVAGELLNGDNTADATTESNPATKRADGDVTLANEPIVTGGTGTSGSATSALTSLGDLIISGASAFLGGDVEQ